METNKHEAALMKAMQRGFPRFPMYDVFEDFAEWVTLSIREPLEINNQEKIREKYKRLCEKYNKQERIAMQEMCGHLIEAMEYHSHCGEYVDVLSRIFQDLGIHNKNTGQFFTPWSVAYLSAKATLDKEKARRQIEEKGYISLYEPTVGGGVMVLAFAQTMSEAGFDPHRQLLIYATDIDYRCCCMTYIHTSLYALPAVIRHGNELELKNYAVWYTPIYVFDLWIARDRIFRGKGNEARTTERIDAGRTRTPPARTGSRAGSKDRGDTETFEQLALPGMS